MNENESRPAAVYRQIITSIFFVHRYICPIVLISGFWGKVMFYFSSPDERGEQEKWREALCKMERRIEDQETGGIRKETTKIVILKKDFTTTLAPWRYHTIGTSNINLPD